MKFKFFIILVFCCNFTHSNFLDDAVGVISDATGVNLKPAVNVVINSDTGKAVINTTNDVIHTINTTEADVKDAINTVQSYVDAVGHIPTVLSKLNGCLQVTNTAIGENAFKEIGAAIESAFNDLFHHHTETSITQGNEGSIIWYINKINGRAKEISSAADQFAAEAAATDGMNPIQFMQHMQQAAIKIQNILNNFMAIASELNSIADKISIIVPSWTGLISYIGNNILKTIKHPASVKQAGVKCANIGTSITTMTSSYKTKINHMTMLVMRPALQHLSTEITNMLTLIQKPLQQLQQLQGA